MAQIEEMYPEEVSNLNSPSECESQCAHGFNQGMLAALRWVLTAGSDSSKAANEHFPELDS